MQNAAPLYCTIKKIQRFEDRVIWRVYGRFSRTITRDYAVFFTWGPTDTKLLRREQQDVSAVHTPHYSDQLFSCTCTCMYLLQVYHMPIYGYDMFSLCSLIFVNISPLVLCRKPCVHSDLPHRFVRMQRMVCTVYVLLVVFDACVPTQICAVGIMSYI